MEPMLIYGSYHITMTYLLLSSVLLKETHIEVYGGCLKNGCFHMSSVCYLYCIRMSRYYPKAVLLVSHSFLVVSKSVF